MKKAVISVMISLIVGGVFFFFGAGMNKAIESMLLGSLIAGIGCIVYAIDSKK